MSLVDQIDFWQKKTGKPLSSFERMVVARPFKYSSYWRKWNRMLKPVYGGSPNGYVEFSLEPSTGWGEGSNSDMIRQSIGEVRLIKIRHHSTLPDKKDVFASQPPDDVIRRMREHFGDEETQYMLYGNIFSHIDWAKYVKVKTLGGGIPLAECRVKSLDIYE
jgi:hypothetical protein